jgi:hypothetical protein
MSPEENLVSPKIKIESSPMEVQADLYGRGWTDGLPVVPPTEELVRRMLSGCDRDPQELIAVLPPKMGQATVEKIAVNAVMAGCLPEYLPVLIAAVEAVAEERFNLLGVLATTHSCGVLMVINGPAARALKINSGGNAFGPGVRVNATLGRALNLVLLNVGGSVPGQVDKSTQGSPGKYTYCVAENESASPWEPFHVEAGYRTEDSTVTVFAAESPHNINDHDSTTGTGILTTIAATMPTAGNNNLQFYSGEPVVVLGPEHAATIAGDGFSKEQVKDFLYEHARLRREAVSEAHIEYRRKSPERYGRFIDSDLLPAARREDIIVMVVGGPGKHSCYIPTFGLNNCVTKKIAP